MVCRWSSLEIETKSIKPFVLFSDVIQTVSSQHQNWTRINKEEKLKCSTNFLLSAYIWWVLSEFYVGFLDILFHPKIKSETGPWQGLTLETLALQYISLQWPVHIINELITREWRMGARRYGISLRVLNSIARENSNFISTSNHVLFGLSYIYILNSPLLTKKSIWLMNENKRIDNSRLKIVKSVGARAQDEKLRRNTTKTNNGRNISGKRPKSACGKSSSCQFLFSAERNAIEYVAFGFSFRVWIFFPFRESLNVTICNDTDFSVF